MTQKNLLTSMFLPVFILLGSTVGANAKVSTAPKRRAPISSIEGKLSTEHKFDELSVRGRYQSGFEGVVTVENEKKINDLLDYRTNYNDRINNSRAEK